MTPVLKPWVKMEGCKENPFVEILYYENRFEFLTLIETTIKL